jgi:hypothetical protein
VTAREPTKTCILPPSHYHPAIMTKRHPPNGDHQPDLFAASFTGIPIHDPRDTMERPLQGVQPNSVQEIPEQSLELWLLKRGHLR